LLLPQNILKPNSCDTMVENHQQDLHDSLAKLKTSGRKGLGISSGVRYIKGESINEKGGRTDGLPNNPLYANFVKEGTEILTEAKAMFDGDGRKKKTNFDDCVDVHTEESGDGDNDKKSRRSRKKEAKLAAKKARRMEEKRARRREEKRARTSGDRSGENGTASPAEQTSETNKSKRDAAAVAGAAPADVTGKKKKKERADAPDSGGGGVVGATTKKKKKKDRADTSDSGAGDAVSAKKRKRKKKEGADAPDSTAGGTVGVVSAQGPAAAATEMRPKKKNKEKHAPARPAVENTRDVGSPDGNGVAKKEKKKGKKSKKKKI